MNFNTFAFHPQINAGISSAGYTTPTPIQSQAIPAIMSGKDVLGLAQTGTGKTAAFVLPLLQRLMKGERGKLRALILAPTRELAEQTHVAISQLGRKTGLRSLTIYGGVSAAPQLKGLRSGVDIAVACPGRLLDLYGQKQISFKNIEFLILDEADQMFDMGFLPSIRRIVAALPKQRQTLLFSATMPDKIRSLVKEILVDPVTVEIRVSEPVDTIDHSYYMVEQTRKREMLLNILDNSGDGQVLVFTRTKHRARKLAHQLRKAECSATALEGNMSQNQRQTAMNKFRKGKVKIMVATDIAARGIDVSRVSHVINYDLPYTVEAYTHRTGRTGRMERLGTALSLVTHEDLKTVRNIKRKTGIAMQRRQMQGFPTEVPPAPPKEANTRTKSKSGGRRYPAKTRN